CNYNTFISRNINTCYSSHRLNTPPYYLSLFLLMLRVVANNHYVPFTSDDLTLFTHWFNLCSYFHHFNFFYFCLFLGLYIITITFPLRLMILHFSHIGLTDALTFIILPPFILESWFICNDK